MPRWRNWQTCLPAGRRTGLTIVFYTYVISSLKNKYLYVGLTNNPERRVAQHQNKKEKTTAPYSPFRILLIEEFQTRQEARNREKYLKSGVGKEWLKDRFEKVF